MKSPIQDLLVILELGRAHLVNLNVLNDDDRQVIVFPFASDQLAHFNHEQLSNSEKLLMTLPSYNPGNNGDSRNDLEVYLEDDHKSFTIYNESTQYTVPLVNDFEYLSDMDPDLFKDIEYQTPSITECVNSRPHSIPRDPEHPQLNLILAHINECKSSSTEAQPTPDSCNLPIDYSNGEMDITGVDWFGSHLYLGSEAEILLWGTNTK